MSVLLALAGGCGIAAGLLLAWTGLRPRPAPSVARPPSRLAGLLARPLRAGNRRRTLVAAVAGLVVLVVTRWPAAAVTTAAAVVWLPMLLSERPVKVQMARLDAIEQWVRKLAGLLGASKGLEEALQTSAAHAPAAIQPEIGQLARRLRAGMSADDALYRLADDLADPVGDLVAVALIQACDVRGEGVQPLLQELAAMVAADVAGRREVEASRAPHRTTVKGVAIIFVLFGAMLAYRHDYSAPYGTLIGQLVLALLLGICGGGLWVMHRLANQAPVQRFLERPDRPTPVAAGGGGEVNR